MGRSTTMPGSIFDFSSAASRAKSGLISMPNGTEPSGRRGTAAPACSSQLRELVAHPLVDRRRRVGPDGILERLELAGPVGLDDRPALGHAAGRRR